MLKACVNAVDKLVKDLVQVIDLSSLSTSTPKYLASQVFFAPRVRTAFKQLISDYKQPINSVTDLLDNYFYTLPTGPMTNTNLIKDLYL